jgi:hypothetical protein
LVCQIFSKSTISFTSLHLSAWSSFSTLKLQFEYWLPIKSP